LILLHVTGLDSFALGVSPTQYFFNRAIFATGDSPEGVALADMNGDGQMDLIVADYYDMKVSILLGQPDGSFSSKHDYPLSDVCQGIVTGDFNRDGKMDVAVTTTTSVVVMLGKGDGTLGSPVSYPVPHVSFLLQAVDINGDGKLDLWMRSPAQARVITWRSCWEMATGRSSRRRIRRSGAFRREWRSWT